MEEVSAHMPSLILKQVQPRKSSWDAALSAVLVCPGATFQLPKPGDTLPEQGTYLITEQWTNHLTASARLRSNLDTQLISVPVACIQWQRLPYIYIYISCCRRDPSGQSLTLRLPFHFVFARIRSFIYTIFSNPSRIESIIHSLVWSVLKETFFHYYSIHTLTVFTYLLFLSKMKPESLLAVTSLVSTVLGAPAQTLDAADKRQLGGGGGGGLFGGLGGSEGADDSGSGGLPGLGGIGGGGDSGGDDSGSGGLLGGFMGGSGTENGVKDNSGCKPLTFIFARGTGEMGNMGTVVGPPVASALGKLVPDGITVQGVDYPASAMVSPWYLTKLSRDDDDDDDDDD